MANVLKSNSPAEQAEAARNVSGLAGFNLSDLADEGRERLQQCREQIRQLLSQAEAEVEQIHKDAEAKGYQAGLHRAAVDAEQRLQEQAAVRAQDELRMIRSAVEQLHTTYQDWMHQYSQVITTIAIAAAERVLCRKLDQEPQLITQWAGEALRSTRSATRLTLAVHPETLARLGPALDELLSAPGLPEQTMVEPDESVSPSDVVVRQVGGEIHAGLQAQLERLEELLS